MSNKTFSQWFHGYQQQTLKFNERRLVVLVGEDAWAANLLRVIDNHNSGHNYESTCLVYGDSDFIKANVSKQRFRDKLGTESHFIIFNSTGSNGTELSIDALAALSGTLVAGGIFFLVINDNSLIEESLFYQRFFNLVKSHSEHTIIEQIPSSLYSLPKLSQLSNDSALKTSAGVLTYGCVTQEQITAVEAIIKVVTGKRNKPLVLTADRGRGKSSALAIACGELLKEATQINKLHIIVTAADLGSLTVFFSQLGNSLPEGKLHNSKFSASYGLVEFVAIDQLLKKPLRASLVLVDEAAAIPIYLLEQLLCDYSRLVFASTIHGYEGAGRGFSLKFQQNLSNKFPHWRSLHIHEPIRWRVDDPLERLVFDACLLNAELPNIHVEEQQLQPSQLLFKQFSSVELVANESLFKQVFAVLVTAHYQTKPSDVQLLLDNPQVQLVCLLSKAETKQQVVAVALLITEGEYSDNSLKTKDVCAVNQSQRRLKNNFVPQSLLTQCGIEYAFELHYLRVMRIAVHPQVQQQGIGSYFLNKITEFSLLQGADFLASSFGATRALLSFWLDSDFQLARIGFSKDKASGEHSALVLKALSPSGHNALIDINTEFYRCFDHLLTDEYRNLAVELVALIQQRCPTLFLPVLSARDKMNIEAFAQGYRQYSCCAFSLHLWLKHQLTSETMDDKSDFHVLISRIMQKHSIADICSIYRFTGKKAFEKYLKSVVLTLLAI